MGFMPDLHLDAPPQAVANSHRSRNRSAAVLEPMLRRPVLECSVCGKRNIVHEWVWLFTSILCKEWNRNIHFLISNDNTKKVSSICIYDRDSRCHWSSGATS